MKETTLTGESKDILNENIETLKELFPEIVSEDKIDFDKFKTIFGGEIDDSSERYSFTWPGKNLAIKESQKQSLGTLRPCKEESKNWEDTQNLYLEGDNLEVLKLLQKGYYNKIKAIYIDPPYNTGNDFIYPDNYKDNINNYLELSGQVSNLDGDEHKIKLSTNVETTGRYHTNWINMMYPRLRLAKNLLKNDGLIFISIDDNEFINLRKICDEIFGEMNFVGVITRKTKLTSNKGTHFAPSHEYIVTYAKSIGFLEPFNDIEAQNDKKYTKLFKNEDEVGKFNEVSLYMPSLDPRRNQRYYIECPDGSLVIPPGDAFPTNKIEGETVPPKSGNDKVWRWTYDTYLKNKKENRVSFKQTTTSPLVDENGNQSKWNIYTKIYLHERLQSGLLPVTFMDKYPNSVASKLLIKLNIPFSFSKPYELIRYLLRISQIKDDDIVLDFFAGSSTTAQAVLDMNNTDNNKRKFILVQIPEAINEKEKAYQLGYRTISELGRKRIDIVGDKYLEESRNKDLDIGFKVFKLDSSNLNKWDPDYDNLEQTLLVSQDNIKDGRTQEDLIYEIMLKYGIDLTLPIEEYDAGENKIYSIGFGALLICLDNKITKDITDSIIELASEDVSRVVFKDNGFASDADKTNIKETLRTHGIDEFITI